MITQLFSSLIILGLGTLYPAYRSYKALKTRDAREYVKWMMYWIVFAICSLISSFTDTFFSFWFPFYYELKIIIVFYLLSPTTTGSSVLYRRFVHPWFVRHEERIDDLILQAKHESYNSLVRVSSRVAHHASSLALNSVVTAHASLENLFYRDQHGTQGTRRSFLSRSQSDTHHLSADSRVPSTRWGWFNPLQSRNTAAPVPTRRMTEPPGGQVTEQESPGIIRRRTEPGGHVLQEEMPEMMRWRTALDGHQKRLTASSVSLRRMVETEEEDHRSSDSLRSAEDIAQTYWQSCSSAGENPSAEENIGSDYGSQLSGGDTEIILEKKVNKKKVVSKKKKVKPLRKSVRRFSMTL